MGCGDEHLLDDELFPHPGLSGQSMSVLDHTRAIPDFTAPEYPLDAAPLNAAGDRLYAGALGFNPHLTGAPSDTTYQHALTRWLGGVKPREIHVPFGLEVQCAVYALPDYDNVKSKLNSHRIFVCGVALVTHTHIQNVHMKRMQARLERRRGSERTRSRCRQGSFALLFRSTQSAHISHLQCKDFIVPTSCSTNTPPPPMPSSQHTPEQFEACAASQWPLA